MHSPGINRCDYETWNIYWTHQHGASFPKLKWETLADQWPSTEHELIIDGPSGSTVVQGLCCLSVTLLNPSNPGENLPEKDGKEKS